MIGSSGVSGKIDKGALDHAFSFLELLKEPAKYERMVSELKELIDANKREADRIARGQDIDRMHDDAKAILATARAQAQELEHLARKKLDEGEKNLTFAWQTVKDKETELDRLIGVECEKLDRRTLEADGRKESLAKWENTLLQMERDLHEDRRHVDDLRLVYEAKCARLVEAIR